MSIAEQETRPKPKRNRRRNFAAELQALESYCKAHVEVLSDPQTQAVSEPDGKYLAGKRVAFEQVLTRIRTGAGNGR